MSTDRTLGLVATKEDWDSLASGQVRPEDALEASRWGAIEPSDELGRVSRRIAAQYAEVIASFASNALAGRTSSGSVTQVEEALDALRRLSTAADDPRQRVLLDQLELLLLPATTGRLNSRSRQGALMKLRSWIPRFAETLEAEDAERMARLVEWERGSVPLLDELAGIRGIGPKRLRRLYAAGLHNVGAVADADPQEVAEVTGLPRKLSERVVEATRRFAVTERRRSLEGMREHALRLRSLLESVPLHEDELFELLARQSLREVMTTFRLLELEDVAKR